MRNRKTFLILITLLSFSMAEAQVNPVFVEPTRKQFDSVKAILSQDLNDTVRMACLREMTLYYIEVNPDSVLYYVRQELPLTEKLNFPLWRADALDLQGIALTRKNNFVESLRSLNDALQIATDVSSEKNIWNISRFSFRNDPHEARLNLLGAIYIDLSTLYGAVRNLNQEKKYLEQGIDIATSINDHTILSIANSRLGDKYQEKGMIDSALVKFQETLNDIKLSGYKKYLGGTLSLIGGIYLDKAMLSVAEPYIRNSFVVNIEQNNMYDLFHSNILMGKWHMAGGNMDSAYFFLKKGDSIINKTGGPTGKLFAVRSLAEYFNKNHKPDSAFKYVQMAMVLSDSVNSAEKLSQFQSIEFAEKLKVQELEKERVNTKNRIRTYSLLAGLSIFSIIAVMLYRNNRQKQKANSLLQQQKDEIESTLVKLKSTQSQLIQSEKMASLGQLTAGIAHEIQNPLNFVNNFSEVNTEMADELRGSLATGNYEVAKDLADNIKTNQEKISEHGKRADSIVKSMLQHSRTNTSQKELTDINSLAEEYLRLSYHGMRAKDKTFNTEFEFITDPTVPLVSIVPQDISRVLINLFNNAFYAVNEKAKSGLHGYTPKVTVTTKLSQQFVMITVDDNGNGIPQKIIDKIFEPFFTTKPTGEGTGLGLSLSYDIITKGHGGKLEVESTEGKGTSFIIELPVT